MSIKEGLGTLNITTSAGVGFKVADANGNEFGEGSGNRSFHLEPGLYAVEWMSGGERSETLVRVSPGVAASAAYQLDLLVERGGLISTIASAPRIIQELRPSEREYGSCIAVVVRAGEGGDPAEVMKELRLFDTHDLAMRSANEKVPVLGLQREEMARCYQVRAGRFRLSYTAHTGETLQQSVPALKGRQTIVFLEAKGGRVLIAEGKGFASVSRSGVDPARTVMITVKGNESDQRLRERLRLTGLLLRDLAGSGAALTEEFCSILGQRSVDPLLRLGAAMVVLTRLEAGASPALDQPLLQDANDIADFQRQWLGRAASWLTRSDFYVLPADIVAAWWQIERLGGNRFLPRCPQSITSPPMYTCAWRWAAARSALRPKAVRRSTALRAAARSGSSSEPWLCWKPAAAKAAYVPASADTRDNDDLARDVERDARLIFDRGRLGHSRSLEAELFEKLGPENGLVVLLLLQLADAEKDARQRPAFAERLASTLSLPGRSLRRLLLRVASSLDTLRLDDRGNAAGSPKFLSAVAEGSQIKREGTRTADRKAGSDLARPFKYQRAAYGPESTGSAVMRLHRPKAAPGLSRRINFPDDPQKGRFGGQQQRQGFSLYADFSATKSKQWIRIVLRIEGPAVDGQPAQFYLHDSFHPQMEEVTFKNGKALLTVTAWGGFTVGAWVPQENVELELDLTNLTNAPDTIRTR